MTITADSSRFGVYYVEEATVGATPTNPKLIEMRLKGDSLNYGLEFIKSEEIRDDRQISDLIQVGAEVGGGLDFELSYESFDNFMQAALFGTWTDSAKVSGAVDIRCSASGASGYPEIIAAAGTSFKATGSTFTNGMWVKMSGHTATGTTGNNDYFHVLSASTSILVLKTSGVLAAAASGAAITIKNDGSLQNGGTKRSFTFEKYFGDIAQYQPMRGCVINSLMVSLASKQIFEGSFEVLGTTAGGFASASIATSTTAANANQIFNAVANLGRIEKDGAVSNLYFKSFDLEVNNNLRGQDAIGTLGYFNIGAGACDVKASIEAYLDADGGRTFFNDAVANKPFDMSLRLIDGDGNGYIFTFYRGKMGNPEVVAGAINEDIMISGDIEFYRGAEAGIGKTIQIDRFNA